MGLKIQFYFKNFGGLDPEFLFLALLFNHYSNQTIHEKNDSCLNGDSGSASI
ncbi:hypothetical protein SAMN04488513_102465 [Pseudozobellia thermophila]|uniref:Uncharacterized protein n=1 Tax=Pseudozobellia thermophila TaxID=192903 RepID=A0A1M6FKE9_9FLAO|nr:hypothetical protein SAMN04488513_102465 [Pseudozobellia thermophila]